MTQPETEEDVKKYNVNTKNSGLSATGCGGVKLFVDDLKHRLHLPLILKGFGDKLYGYKLASLVLLLLCRPQIGAASIAGLREKLLTRFISRLFYLQFEAKTNKATHKRQGSVDILYDLFEKLDPKPIQRAMNNHLRRMRREGKVGKSINLVVDSLIIELSVKNLSKSRFSKIGGRKIRGKYYKGFKVYLGIDLQTKAIVYVAWCRIRVSDSKMLIPIVFSVRKLGFTIDTATFDRGFWSGANFKFLDRKAIKFYTVLKHYSDEYRQMVEAVNSRTAGRRRLQQNVWVTEIGPISLPTYFSTKTLRCFVVRMKGTNPWAIITNDQSIDQCRAVTFYLQRNMVEKVIQELLDDYAIGKLPRSDFSQNRCWVLLTTWSYNLFVDFKMERLGHLQPQILHRKLSTLRRQILDVSAVVYYRRKAIVLTFENPPPLLLEALSAFT